jgi:molecular chaperone DnaJ
MPSGFGQDFGFNFNFDTFFGRDAYQQQHTQRLAPDIHIEKEISFKDSIFGTSLPISFDRLSACKSCDGAGVILSDEKCPHCNGQGGTKTRKGNMIFATTCQHCRGSGKKLITCTTCNGTASVKTNIKLNVTIPAGVKSGNALRVPGKGHHAENHIYSNLIVRIKVTPDNNFEVIGTDVLVKVDLSLREAVFGCEKEVITLDGNKTVTVPPLTRHNEVLRIPNLGVGRSGVQVCVFQVAYPDNIKEILDTTAVCKTS